MRRHRRKMIFHPAIIHWKWRSYRPNSIQCAIVVAWEKEPPAARVCDIIDFRIEKNTDRKSVV